MDLLYLRMLMLPAETLYVEKNKPFIGFLNNGLHQTDPAKVLAASSVVGKANVTDFFFYYLELYTY